jgi:putative oxidoreductase
MKIMTAQNSSKSLNITLWILQVLVAAFFLMAGTMKLTQPIVKLSAMLPWTGQIPEILVRLLGMIDIVGAVGILLPGILRTRPRLIIWAALGIMLLMASAITFHISRGEAYGITPNILILLLAAAIAWGRTKKASVEARSSKV